MIGIVLLGACSSDEPPAPAAPSKATSTRSALTPLDQVRVDPNEVVKVQGSKMRLNPHDTIVSRVIRRDGIWEPLETKLFTEQIEPGDVVIDVGANIGYYTLLAARLVGPTGHVHAFEPEPEAFALLERNVELNGYDNVTLVPKALGQENGRLALFLATNNRGDHRVYDPSGRRSSIDVDVVTLDAYLAEHDVDRVDFLKIDTQGAECSILDGARRTIARHSEMALVMELTPHALAELGDDPRGCLKRLLAAGYSLRDIQEWERAIVPTDIETLLRTYPEDDPKKFTNLFLPRRQARDGSPVRAPDRARPPAQ